MCNDAGPADCGVARVWGGGECVQPDVKSYLTVESQFSECTLYGQWREDGCVRRTRLLGVSSDVK